MTAFVFDRESVRRIGGAVRWVENQPAIRTDPVDSHTRSFRSVEVFNLSNTPIPEGGVMRIYAVKNNVYYCVVPSFPSISSFGVMSAPVAPKSSGSMVLSGIARALPYDPGWITSYPIGHRWNIYRDTYCVTPESSVGPFVSVGRDVDNGFIQLRIDNGRNFAC